MSKTEQSLKVIRDRLIENLQKYEKSTWCDDKKKVNTLIEKLKQLELPDEEEVNDKKMILTPDMNLVPVEPEPTAKEMFKNIKLFGKTAHYTRVGYDLNTDEPLEECEKAYDFGDIVVEWITPSKRAMISFDMQRKDFFTFVTEQDNCEGAAYNGISTRPMDMNIIIHKAIQKQLEELGWV